MKEILIDSYDRSAATYDDQLRPLQRVKYETLLGADGGLLTEALGPRGRLLDLGCGTGLLAEWLQQVDVPHGPIFGVDLSKGMLERAATRSVQALQADVDALPFPDRSFRVVASFTALRLFGQESLSALRETARVLEPGGAFFVSVLKGEWDSSFEEELRQVGFTPGARLECGQDFGYRCRRG